MTFFYYIKYHYKWSLLAIKAFVYFGYWLRIHVLEVDKILTFFGISSL